MAVNDASHLERTVHRAVVSLTAGSILLLSGIGLATVTPDNAPWLGSWLNGVFREERSMGGILIGLGVLLLAWWIGIWMTLGVKNDPERTPEHAEPTALDAERSEEALTWSAERRKALIQQFFNPPHPPKPDWGETLRGVGLFAALVTIVWYLAGAPPVGNYRLDWLRAGFDAYGSGLLVLAGLDVSSSVPVGREGGVAGLAGLA